VTIRRIVGGEILSFLVILTLDNGLADGILTSDAPLDAPEAVHITKDYETTIIPIQEICRLFFLFTKIIERK
jgi:hypothetical protein